MIHRSIAGFVLLYVRFEGVTCFLGSGAPQYLHFFLVVDFCGCNIHRFSYFVHLLPRFSFFQNIPAMEDLQGGGGLEIRSTRCTPLGMTGMEEPL